MVEGRFQGYTGAVECAGGLSLRHDSAWEKKTLKWEKSHRKVDIIREEKEKKSVPLLTDVY